MLIQQGSLQGSDLRFRPKGSWVVFDVLGLRVQDSDFGM